MNKLCKLKMGRVFYYEKGVFYRESGKVIVCKYYRKKEITFSLQVRRIEGRRYVRKS